MQGVSHAGYHLPAGPVLDETELRESKIKLRTHWRRQLLVVRLEIKLQTPNSVRLDSRALTNRCQIPFPAARFVSHVSDQTVLQREENKKEVI
jgi:hypothetical protein